MLQAVWVEPRVFLSHGAWTALKTRNTPEEVNLGKGSWQRKAVNTNDDYFWPALSTVLGTTTRRMLAYDSLYVLFRVRVPQRRLIDVQKVYSFFAVLRIVTTRSVLVLGHSLHIRN